ncbi:MAG: DUF342 domain-containing protein [Phycisphaerae bacterium]|nr:DUF342 domain-containing protein [Phycisphaerae bacterium]
MNTETKSLLLVRVSGDHISAAIEARPDAELSTVSTDDVAAALREAKVAVDDQVTQRVEQYVEALHDPEGPPKDEYEIAAGYAPTEGEDGTFVWEDSLQKKAADWCDDAPVDFYNISSIVTVEAGALIGWITPPKPGTDGMDVHGNPLQPRRKLKEVVLKNGVELGEDQSRVIATVPGKVVYENHELSICEVLEVRGDVDFETGNLNLATNVIVRGSVRDLFCVKTKKNLTVGGAIEAAEVEAVGNVTVRGGILNRGKGKVVAAGEIVARFCAGADLHAGGDIRIAKEVLNSHVHTESRLILPQSSIIGGDVFARCSVEASTLGSEAGVPTEIIVGLHPDELRKIRTTAKENAVRCSAVERIRQAVSPLMAQLKRLTPEQREKATELMYQADTIEAGIKESEQKVAALTQRPPEAKPYVLVASKIHGRVSITIDDRVVTFEREVKGPIRVEFRKIKNHTVLAVVNQLTGSVHELPARNVELRPD